MERWGLSPRVSTPSPGQCHVCQRHLRQWRADGDLAEQPTDTPCTPRARTTRPYTRRAQRQCRTPSLMRLAMRARALSAPFGRRASLDFLFFPGMRSGNPGGRPWEATSTTTPKPAAPPYDHLEPGSVLLATPLPA